MVAPYLVQGDDRMSYQYEQLPTTNGKREINQSLETISEIIFEIVKKKSVNLEILVPFILYSRS